MPKSPVTVGSEVDDEAAARPMNLEVAGRMNLDSVQRLQRFADVHQLHVDALLRVLRAQEDLARAVWGTRRAWRGGSSEDTSAGTRSRVPGLVYLLLASVAALATGLTPQGLL